MSTPSDTYNYDTFRPAPYVEGGCDGPGPGEYLGGARLWRPDDATTTLGAFVTGTTVLETGSTTCPLYRGNIRRMRRLARRHPDVRFAVLYTRGAHPGGRRGPHRGLDDKRATAAVLGDQAGEWREVLVDDLDGPLHRRLAGAPNSVVVLDGDARVIRWMHDTDPAAVDAVLAGYAAGDPTVAPRAAFRPAPPHTTLRALLRGGASALWDFVRAMPTLLRYRLGGGADC
jgi:hypothetical protein